MPRPLVIPPQGTIFGNLVSTGRTANVREGKGRVRSMVVLECRCGFGNIVKATPHDLFSGKSSACKNCAARKLPITGETVGRLVLTGLHQVKRRGAVNMTFWQASCTCGSPPRYYVPASLKNGETRSCGCLKREQMYERLSSKDYTETFEREIVRSVKRGASDRHLPFALSDDQTILITRLDCHYCGESPSNTRKLRGKYKCEMKWNGIDRIDSSVGYLESNVVPCCWNCNRAKSTLSYQEFITLAAKICKNTEDRECPKQHY